MFQKLIDFHKKTMERYQQGIEQEMEDWKKDVMRIHEKAAFLFYADELDPEREPGIFLIRGELVRGSLEPGAAIRILDGQGGEIASALMLGSPEEKEDRRKRLLRRKRNEFRARAISIKGRAVSDMDATLYGRSLRSLAMEMSLIIGEEDLSCLSGGGESQEG